MAGKDDKTKDVTKKTTTKKKTSDKSTSKKSAASGIAGVIGSEHKKARRLKVSRKEMRSDELQEVSVKLVNYLTAHGNGVLIIAGSLIAALLIFVVFNFYSSSRKERANELFSKARNMYNLALSETPPNSVTLKNSLELFESLKSTYKGRVEASLADFYEGNIYFNLKEYDDAIKAYEAFLSSGVKNDTYKAIAKLNIAYCHKNKGENELAVDSFKEISSTASGYLKESALFDLGLTYENMDKTGDALQLYNDFVESYPASALLEKVRERIDSIQAKH